MSNTGNRALYIVLGLVVVFSLLVFGWIVTSGGKRPINYRPSGKGWPVVEEVVEIEEGGKVEGPTPQVPTSVPATELTEEEKETVPYFETEEMRGE